MNNNDNILDKIFLELKELRVEVVSLKKENKLLKDENKKLKEIINKNSTNSSKPPSTDNGFKNSESNKNRSTKAKKRGGQKGSTTNNLKKVDTPDKIEILEIDNCKNCNHTLKDIDAHSISTKQEFDIPKIKMEVTEYQQHTKVCPCCHTVNKPQFPEHLKSHVQYGDNIKTFIGYLNTYQMVPYERISELVKDFTSHSISVGTINNMLRSFHSKLESYEIKIKELLLKSEVINVDETGTRVKDTLHWTHTVSTNQLTYYMIHKNRGAKAMDDMEILPQYTGIAVHDHWGAYIKYLCSHSFCNAHYLQELTSITENENVLWTKDIHKLLTNMNNYIYTLKENNKTSPSKRKLQHYYKEYDTICSSALKYYPSPPDSSTKRKPKQSKGKNLLDRFIKYKDETLRFFVNLLVPFTNNLAERDLRMIKVKEKISGTFASFKGAEMFNRIRGFISTMKKNGKSVLSELANVLKGKAYIPVVGC